MSEKASCIYSGYWVWKSDPWWVSISPITTSEQGFIEHEIVIAGPGKFLTGTYRVGYERLVIRIILFYSSDCAEIPYIYLRLALGNRKNSDEIFTEGGNTKIFDPGEGWTAGFEKHIHAAIRHGAEKEIAAIWGEHEE
ncbi:hypothetical protein EQ718_01840 [Paracoccus versutus]|uniref:hypothetical protein n=1 Tax=Paracoccus versutus TaxID=34007 RepID=UPI0011C04B63|nr:hypothetical protein [Paracoccus versutus]WEJ77703.1 hypothetical protein EQ718_01840 [Paracoccus versutus]